MLKLTKPLQEKDAAAALSIDRQMRGKLPKLPNPIVASWDERHRLVIDRGEPWIVGPLEIDPYLTKTGGYPFPKDVGAQLERISMAGARFHRIVIAHEVDRTGPVVAVLPKVPRAGLAISAKDAKVYLGRTPSPEKPKDMAASFDKAIRKVVRAGAAGAAVVGAMLTAPMLDPIVFGVVGVHGQPRNGEPAICYPLAAWRW
jgi:hypothetical protein